MVCTVLTSPPFPLTVPATLVTLGRSKRPSCLNSHCLPSGLLQNACSCKIVRDARVQGKNVKAVGCGHSFSPVAAVGNGGVILDISDMCDVLEVDKQRCWITVEVRDECVREKERERERE